MNINIYLEDYFGDELKVFVKQEGNNTVPHTTFLALKAIEMN